MLPHLRPAILLLFAVALCAEEPKEKAPEAKPPAVVEPAPKPKKPSRYKLPENADAQTLIDFCEKLIAFEPASEKQQLTHETKLPIALRKACQRIVEME